MVTTLRAAEHHAMAATLLESSARHHRKAAKASELGDHEKAAHHNQWAHEDIALANQHGAGAADRTSRIVGVPERKFDPDRSHSRSGAQAYIHTDAG